MFSGCGKIVRFSIGFSIVCSFMPIHSCCFSSWLILMWIFFPAVNFVQFSLPQKAWEPLSPKLQNCGALSDMQYMLYGDRRKNVTRRSCRLLWAKIAFKLPNDLEGKIYAFHRLIINLHKETNFELAQIGNMAKIPKCFDLPSTRTIYCKGNHTVQIRTTGHEKLISQLDYPLEAIDETCSSCESVERLFFTQENRAWRRWTSVARKQLCTKQTCHHVWLTKDVAAHCCYFRLLQTVINDPLSCCLCLESDRCDYN